MTLWSVLVSHFTAVRPGARGCGSGAAVIGGRGMVAVMTTISPVGAGSGAIA